MARFDEGLSPLDLWQGLDGNAVSWSAIRQGDDPDRDELCQRIDGSGRQVLSYLADFPAHRWLSIGLGAGWTSYGAVALSWCKDARLADVWAGWEASGFPLLPKPEFERPARFINPDLMPPLATISEIINAEHELHERQGTYTIAICARIVAAGDSFTFDLPYEKLIKAQPQISAFLKSRMLRIENRSAEQNKLIDIWSAKIKGTPFDIWADTPVEPTSPSTASPAPEEFSHARIAPQG